MSNHDLKSVDQGLSDQSELDQPALSQLRIPLRWRWTALVGFAVTIAVAVLYMIILDIERDAWLQNQATQAELQVERLSDELKLPLLSGSSSETGVAVQRFLHKVPTVLGVLIHLPNGSNQSFGSVESSAPVLQQMVANPAADQSVIRLPLQELWYAKAAMFDQTSMGIVAVRFSEQQWGRIANKLTQEILTAAVFVVLFSALLVFWIAGRMSEPIEMLAVAAAKVSDGDYQVQLKVSGNDELSDALRQFNVMVRALAHKEALRDVFGRYLNPKLVSDVFESADVDMSSRRQEVSVLFADMVNFAPFSESTDTSKVVAVLNQYFELFHHIISHFGGHVDKYIGDAVMVVFNHPLADEQHARRAAMAALAMAVACQKLATQGHDGEPIRFRFGLNCGQAIVGNIGAVQRLEYTVIGDAVNVASRMTGLGDGNELIMSRQTFDLLGADFNFDSIGMCDIKGLKHAMEVGRVREANQAARLAIDVVVAAAFESWEGQADA
ncbi:MAG: adenylate/guanylate cyclase domain-containing protein [Mariprofundus sp.]|nr:adenylate/guanylate cyclase domain-containing protein [Mariprofundus sp.]